jgi:hypothetical protein
VTRSLILIVTPRGGKGAFVGYIEGTEFRLIASKVPMLSAARSLLAVGVDPRTILKLRTAGSTVDRLSGPIGVLVRKLANKGGRKPAPASPMRYSGPAAP